MSRRRKINRDVYRLSLRSKGDCPKCRQHVGTGLNMHEKFCKGLH